MSRKSTNEKRLLRVSRLALLTNSIQIICAVALFCFALFSKSFHLSARAEIALVAVTCCILIWGAVVDIRDAMITHRIEEQNQMLEEAYSQLEDLNTTLRRQRHDFKNHLQVVYTLTEMQAHSDALDYVKRIYEDVQSVGSLMRTAVPAVNALLSAKNVDCQEHGIDFMVDIQSNWADIPVTGWELCRIIGNLIDNAMDALLDAHSPAPQIKVFIGENIHAFTLQVENNGPEIKQEHKKSILIPGFTTKSAGHGNGLSIIQELVDMYNGEFSFDSNSEVTRFNCVFPRGNHND